MGIKWASGKGFSMNMRIDYGRDIDTKFVVTIYQNADTIIREFGNYNDADDFFDEMYEHLYNP